MTENNGHYSGRIKQLIDKATEEVKGNTKKFYSIMKSHGFYDINDPDNKLADYQRAAVPDYNQHRISDLCDALAEIIQDFFSNEDYGVLYPGVESMVNKLDMRGSMNKTSIDSTQASMAANPFTAPSAAAAKTSSTSLEALVASIMGGNPFDPDLIPPISIGLEGLPISFANLYKPGTFTPDWNFLYDHETYKSTKFYEGSNGNVSIGAGIDLSTGGAYKIILLKSIFPVPDVDENGNPKGDAVNGITAEQFDIIKTVADKKFSELTDEEKSFELREGQLRMAYFKRIQLILWGAIKNPNNWAYLHWGCLAHNSCPEPVKTAICSYLQTNGLAVDVKNHPISGTISYCLNTGMAYLIGKSKPTPLLLLPGMKYLASDKSVVEVGDLDDASRSAKWFTDNNGVPKDEKLAKLHFTYIADILSHLTYDQNPDAESLRRRRIDEANKIYSYVGYPTITFGSAFIDTSEKFAALKKRYFDVVIKSTIKVYENKNISIPVDPSNIKLLNYAEKGANDISEITAGTLRYLASKAGIPGVVITSVYRSPEAQAKAMFNNRQTHNGAIAVNYSSKGRAVDAIYTDASKKANNGVLGVIKNTQLQNTVRSAMEDKIREYAEAGNPVSNHGYDQTKVQAVDMGPNSMKSALKITDEQLDRFRIACYDAYKEGYLKQFLCPESFGGPKTKDPAFHVEIWQDSTHKHPSGVGSSDYSNMAILPTVECINNDVNLVNGSSWDLVFVHDQQY